MSDPITTQPKERPTWLDNPEVIVFAGERELAIGAIEQHSLRDWAGNLFGRTKEQVRADWEKVVGQIGFLLEEASVVTKDYDLNEITFQLGFSAEGQIVFVAKAGVTTTISAKFVRRKLDDAKADDAKAKVT